MTVRFAGAAALVALGLAASPASADGAWLGVSALGWQQTPGFFVAPGVEGGFQRLPRWTSPISLHAPVAVGAPQVNVFSTSPNVAGIDAGLTAGYVFNDGALPPWLGARVRIGLTGTWQNYSDTTTTSFASGPTLVQYLGIDGRVIGLQTTGGANIAESLRIHREGFGLNLRVASDFPLRPDIIFTPSVAVFGGHVRDQYEYQHALAVSNLNYSATERLRTWSAGGEVAGGLTWQATSFLALNVTARGGVVWMRSRMEGNDCISFTGNSCTAPAIIGVALNTGSVTDSRSRVGFRGGLSMGAALDMRFGILSIGGSFTYDSAIPGVNNPGLANASTTPGNVGPARIRFDDGFRYGGYLNLRIPLIWM